MYAATGNPTENTKLVTTEWVELVNVLGTLESLEVSMEWGSGNSPLKLNVKANDIRMYGYVLPSQSTVSVPVNTCLIHRTLGDATGPRIAEALKQLAEDLKKELALEVLTNSIAGSDALLKRIDHLVKTRIEASKGP